MRVNIKIKIEKVNNPSTEFLTVFELGDESTYLDLKTTAKQTLGIDSELESERVLKRNKEVSDSDKVSTDTQLLYHLKIK